MKSVVNLSQRTNKNPSPYWEIGWHKNSIHCRYPLIHVYAHLFLVINFAREPESIIPFVWCNRKFVVVTTQLTNEFQVAVNLLRKWSHVTTKCGRKQKSGLRHSRVDITVKRLCMCETGIDYLACFQPHTIHVASHELQTTTRTWRSWFFQI